MKEKYYHKKLIRDKIPEIIEASGNKLETKVLNDSEFKKELKKKLLEEAREVIRATKDEIPNELADVLEIVKSISSHYKINFKDIEKQQINKRRKRGGFKRNFF